MKRRFTNLSGLFMLVLIFSAGGKLFADGFLVPGPQIRENIFSVKYHHVDVYIDEQAATTKVDEVFHNDSSVDQEGTYVFPLPKDASIHKFSMFVGEEEAKGKILTRDEARNLYESIVRSRKDPALLEYMDRNTFRARVYPIPARGDKRIRLEYNEVLSANGSMCRYVYPLSTEQFSSKPLDDVKVTIRLKSASPITNIYSPTHPIKIEQTTPSEATVTWAAKDVKPDQDLVIYYSRTRKEVALDLLSYGEKGKQGYFMLLASPNIPSSKSIKPKSVVFVVDRTGSMAGEKIDQAKAAMKYCLNSLKTVDKFNVLSFNETPDPLWEKPMAASAANVHKAISYVDKLDASGGTNLDAALKSALKTSDQSAKETLGAADFVILITDGLPTVGEQNIENILKNAKGMHSRARIFTFGVGYDVNTHLLDLVAEMSGGIPDYVLPNENIESRVSGFFSKVSEPVLTDISIKAKGARILDVFPTAPMPDLFRDSQMIILGRYDGSGPVTFTLAGKTSTGPREWNLSVDLSTQSTDRDFIPQIWASRKIGYLLDQVRLHRSDELIKEIVMLSKDWGIPTEFTSFLVEEPTAGQSLDSGIDGAVRRAQEARDMQSGSWGVSQSLNSNALKNVSQAPASPSTMGPAGPAGSGRMAENVKGYVNSEGTAVVVTSIQNIGTRTFYQRGNQWVDAQVDGRNLKPMQIRQFSNAHFKLLHAIPELNRYQRLGNMTLLINSQAVEIGTAGKEELTDAELKGLLETS